MWEINKYISNTAHPFVKDQMKLSIVQLTPIVSLLAVAISDQGRMSIIESGFGNYQMLLDLHAPTAHGTPKSGAQTALSPPLDVV